MYIYENVMKLTYMYQRNRLIVLFGRLSNKYRIELDSKEINYFVAANRVNLLVIFSPVKNI